ncbi:tRNA-specific adenosine deaminase 1 [Nymphon striatum]|nr:tRNA-specific adenosine deaminase 1 [Nymphon striatum]
MNKHEKFADYIAKTCYDFYERQLPKTGKPLDKKEWTILAAILMKNESSDIINDCHAEILARRSFMRFLCNEILMVYSGKGSEILTKSSNSHECILKNGISFHLFISHTPCGDASIFAKKNNASLKRSFDDFNNDEINQNKKVKLSNYVASDIDDIFRTGAKCVVNGPQDSKTPGSSYHILGALRTKPGRGDPTLSMSCSDKIARWNILGIQGSLLMQFLNHPVYLSTITIGQSPFCEKALDRAIYDRIKTVSNLPSGFSINKPRCVQSNLEFKCSRSISESQSSNAVPSSSCIIWNASEKSKIEVAVGGKKQGITKKLLNSDKARCSVCKMNMFQLFHNILSALKEKPSHLRDPTVLTYKQFKECSRSYMKAKEEFLSVFKGWMEKPQNLRNFTLPDFVAKHDLIVINDYSQAKCTYDI